jgi:hypothetical protein
MKKYKLVCPDCGSKHFYRVAINITLFNSVDTSFTDEDYEFETTYFEELQVTDDSKYVLSCEECEFELSIDCKNNDEGTDKKLMEAAIKEGVAVEVSVA